MVVHRNRGTPTVMGRWVSYYKRVRPSRGAVCSGVGLLISSNIARPWLWPFSTKEKRRPGDTVCSLGLRSCGGVAIHRVWMGSGSSSRHLYSGVAWHPSPTVLKLLFLSFFLQYSNGAHLRRAYTERRGVIAAAFLCTFSSPFKLVLVDRMIGLRWTFAVLCADLCVSDTRVHITKCDIRVQVDASLKRRHVLPTRIVIYRRL